MLALDQYRTPIALDHPFVAPPPTPGGQTTAVVRGLIEHLLVDGTVAGLGMETEHMPERDDAEGQRQLLRALLTVREPRPLPDWFNETLDAWLQHELTLRGTTGTDGLPRLLDLVPRSAYPAAARCALWQGDITLLAADAIVNAANKQFLGCFIPFHPCIDNAIHWAAGPRLREDCAQMMQIQGRPEPTGTAKATRGYNLPARYVLHTVGPIVRGPLRDAHATALAACYQSCLDLATQLEDVRSVAICAISTGVFGYPRDQAARVALDTVAAWLDAHPGALDLVIFNVFGDADRDAYFAALDGGRA